jgi:hypothetical protein
MPDSKSRRPRRQFDDDFKAQPTGRQARERLMFWIAV